LRANRPDVPIVVIVEPDGVRPAAELVVRLRLQGYIPTASSMEVAAAVLRLIAAGGTYIPDIQGERAPPMPTGRILTDPVATRTARLTPRERAVLELLERGMSNKIIAYRLSLSQSTVKVHVHNILSKLKVSNRTAAAVAARLQSANIADQKWNAVVTQSGA
jgi:DNA-binding NarL/FixJ family response regulator